MKQTFAWLFVFSFFFTAASYSQIAKGFWMLGGNGSFENSKTNYPQGQIKVTHIRISPNVRYFFVDKFATGLRIEGLAYLNPGGPLCETPGVRKAEDC